MMKYEQFWMMCAATGATMVIIGGAATAALAQQTNKITVVGERPVDDGRSIRVSYRDLNLASAHDERQLRRRVGGAAHQVCEPVGFPVGDHSFSDCVSFAWNGAKPQMARAVRRAREIAATGSSGIPLVAISIVGSR